MVQHSVFRVQLFRITFTFFPVRRTGFGIGVVIGLSLVDVVRHTSQLAIGRLSKKPSEHWRKRRVPGRKRWSTKWKWD